MQRSKGFVIAVLCVSMAMAGCHTLREVSLPQGTASDTLPAVKPGDTVVATLKSGAKQKFVITGVTLDALVGRDIRVPYSDIQTLQVERLHTVRTIGATAGIVVGALTVMVYVVVRALVRSSD